MTIKNFLWTLPFISFLCGYFILYNATHVKEIIAPSVVGKTVEQTLTILSHNNLNIRLLAQKNEANLPEGTILRQTPSAGQKIKPRQSIFLVVSKKPPVDIAPDFVNKKLTEINKQLATTSIRPRIYYVSTVYPSGTCFAQHPQSGEPIKNNRLLLYISAGDNKPIIWPNFCGKNIQEIINFLDVYKISPQIIHHIPKGPSHSCSSCQVIEQRPFAGTLLTLEQSKPVSVQLRVK